MPDGIRDTDAPTMPALTPAADVFHVIREERSMFPGNWKQLQTRT
jgi:hypothetical protein